MNINIRRGGDDYFFNRLFSYLNSELDGKIVRMKPLRGNVYFVEAEHSRFILKGFNDLRKLKIQEAFASSLKKSGFDQSYRFLRMNKNPLHFEGVYYGCIQYLDHHQKRFDYGLSADRLEGIELLSHFHDHTSDFVASYTGMLPKADLARKWHHRNNEFTSNLHAVHFYVNRNISDKVIEWAECSLEYFDRVKQELEQEPPAILHGDVAHHNFLRSKDGKLYLIDYDLISVGPRAYDMLQYANRILPFLDWKLDALQKISQLKIWLDHEAFLYGLLYPADILREWNRLFRDRKHITPISLAPVIEMTVNQFHKRKRFQQEVKSIL
ncbi:phosphotransferase [Mesobacillus jeotgali]|uniref:phosphotransferase n=1 Tax=Mesobacillus jeotgali TaxID=129985 RepID=UPI0015908A03|nr:phosphotransferase [Mesobacillus jeotgali]